MADHFVIDGSNLATEGRTEPSLAQLEDGVAAFLAEHPGVTVTVVVDASFEHRIDPSERDGFARVEAAGEVISPPAGAVGRGDGFLLQIANRVGGAVVSNDSFQEFHAEYDWLFEPGRLIGGKPVPGVGWIFSLRRPVRGIVSRKTIQKAKDEAKGKAKKSTKAEKQVRQAIAEATADALQEDDTPKRRRRRGGRGRSRSSEQIPPPPSPGTLNEPASFLQFVIDHRLGTTVEGRVDAFASHGAFVVVDGVRCYVPLSAMGDPPPTRARDLLTKDEGRTFVVQAVDAPRRGIELGLPDFAKVAGAPSDETVAAEVRRNRPKPRKSAKKPAAVDAAAGGKRTAKAAKKKTPSTKSSSTKAPAAKTAPAKKPAVKKPAVKKPAVKKPAVKRTAAAGEPAPKKGTTKKGTTKKGTAKKAAAKDAAAKTGGTKQGGTKKAAAKVATAKKQAGKRPG